MAEICQCLTNEGIPCSRSASLKPEDDKRFCWQHQNCKNMIGSIGSVSAKPRKRQETEVEKQSAQKTEKQKTEKQKAEKLKKRKQQSAQKAEKQKSKIEVSSDEGSAQELGQDKLAKAGLKMLFPPLKDVNQKQLRLTDISLYSVTPWKEANMISRRIIHLYKEIDIPPSKLTITDATANVGGNTISFYLNGVGHVNSVEIDDLTCEILTNNLLVYKLPTDFIYCTDYLSIYKTLVQDCVFLDPPWGGPNYKKTKSLDLYLGKVNVIDLCAELLNEKRATMIVLKAPTNYNLSGLKKRLTKNLFEIQQIYRGHKHSYNVIYIY